MPLKQPRLTREEYERIARYLTSALVVFQENKALTASEIRVKSMIAALRSEIEQRGNEVADGGGDESRGPWN